MSTDWNFLTHAQEANVKRIAVGVGKGVDDSELEQIASRKDDVLHVGSYLELDAKLDEIVNMTCKDQYPGNFVK